MANRIPAVRSMFPPPLPVTLSAVEGPIASFKPDSRFAICLYDSQCENNGSPYYKLVEIAAALQLHEFKALCTAFNITDTSGIIYPLDYIKWVLELDKQ